MRVHEGTCVCVCVCVCVFICERARFRLYAYFSVGLLAGTLPPLPLEPIPSAPRFCVARHRTLTHERARIFENPAGCYCTCLQIAAIGFQTSFNTRSYS